MQIHDVEIKIILITPTAVLHSRWKLLRCYFNSLQEPRQVKTAMKATILCTSSSDKFKTHTKRKQNKPPKLPQVTYLQFFRVENNGYKLGKIFMAFFLLEFLL